MGYYWVSLSTGKSFLKTSSHFQSGFTISSVHVRVHLYKFRQSYFAETRCSRPNSLDIYSPLARLIANWVIIGPHFQATNRFYSRIRIFNPVSRFTLSTSESIYMNFDSRTLGKRVVRDQIVLIYIVI